MIVGSFVLAKTKRYRPPLWLGWALYLAGLGGFSTLGVTSGLARTTGFAFIASVAAGLIYPAIYFPVLAPLPVAENARALALFMFTRSFAGVCPVTFLRGPSPHIVGSRCGA